MPIFYCGTSFPDFRNHGHFLEYVQTLSHFPFLDVSRLGQWSIEAFHDVEQTIVDYRIKVKLRFSKLEIHSKFMDIQRVLIVLVVLVFDA